MKKLKELFAPRIPQDIGEIYFEWSFPEYIKEIRSRAWYLVASAVLGLFLLYAILTVNYLFAVILVLAVLIILYQYFQEAREIVVKIGEDGIIIDAKFYEWKSLKNFWIVYQPPIKVLYLEFKDRLTKSISVPLQSTNPLELREILLEYLNEDLTKDEEELSDTLARILKIR